MDEVAEVVTPWLVIGLLLSVLSPEADSAVHCCGKVKLPLLTSAFCQTLVSVSSQALSILYNINIDTHAKAHSLRHSRLKMAND